MSNIIYIIPLTPLENSPFCNCEIKTSEGIKKGLVSNSIIDAYDKKGLVIWEDDKNE